MEDKKYQIFVSSTYEDLETAREKIFETILKLYHFPIGMEMFSADDDEQWEVIKDTIDMSDYYIVIIGHRYGSETSDGVSFTEKEYDYAKSKNIPILAFIRNRDVATKPNERDENPDKFNKLNNFIEKASQNKMCDFWKTEDDLAKEVAIALPKEIRKKPQIGWVRADKAISPQVSEEIAKLSGENRNLRLENEQLQAQIEGKKPDIYIKINDQEKLELSYIEKEDLYIEIPKGHRLPFKPAEYPKNIVLESIPEHLHPYFEASVASDIEKYNKSLPTADEIDEYNWYKEIYYRVKSASIDFNINIENFGTSKANEIFINIECHEGLKFLKKGEIDKFDFPDSPIPQNPIKLAEKKFKEEQERRLKLNDLGFNPSIFNPLTDSTFRSPNIPELFRDITVKRDITTDLDINKNRISIEIASLLHTRKVPIDDFIAVPMETGDFEITASIVCEEYTEPKEIIIPIKVI